MPVDEIFSALEQPVGYRIDTLDPPHYTLPAWPWVVAETERGPNELPPTGGHPFQALAPSAVYWSG